LHNGLGLAVDGQDHRPLALLHLLKKFPRFPPAREISRENGAAEPLNAARS
jgi:hypothetical protein